jgi:ABC-type transport system involved in Fe-S cluster assembly fused permease/ATPase subunit
LTIAHRLATVIHADQIIVLENGEVVEKGTHPVLVNYQGAYAEMVSAYQGGGE